MALWQAHHVQHLLEKAGVRATCHVVKTTGDLTQDRPLHQLGTVGIFTKALDEALHREEVDIAVHSAKDMPAVLEEGLELLAILKREDPRDVLLAASPDVSLENLTRPLVIGTSSLRRAAFLKHFAPHITVKDIRGNVDSRLEKMRSGAYDGILLAYAGVRRMKLESWIVQKLNVHTFTPAVGQGAVAVVCRQAFAHQATLREVLNHRPTELCVRSERSYLKTVAGGCSVPVFGLANLTGEALTLSAGIAAKDGQRIFRHNAEGTASRAEAIGEAVGKEILAQTKGLETIF